MGSNPSPSSCTSNVTDSGSCSRPSRTDRARAYLSNQHPDVRFLAVRPGRLVDAADRAGGAAEQLGVAQQDALEQRAQRELTGQVLGDGDQPAARAAGLCSLRSGPVAR
ncbi:hypothetical protein [Trebonia sp.]|uniref:hypothetical protein n=1 Tax=Trebonia sp. TaxID=2767075 RepID=UPI002602FB43|nr:hypothetical protein [Trebonia sp.]